LYSKDDHRGFQERPEMGGIHRVKLMGITEGLPTRRGVS